MRLRSALLCALLPGWAIPAMAKDHTIIVSAPNRGYREAPVTFTVDAPRDFAGVALFEKNVPVPVQARLVNGKAEVTFVLHRFCARWLPEFAIAEIGVDFRGLGGAVGPGVNLDDVEVDSASRSDRRISIDQDKVDNWTGSCISPIQACLVRFAVFVIS